MRVLIVKLSSLGDVVHAMPVVHDIGAALQQAAIDWVVEPGFAPLLRRMEGLDEVIAFIEKMGGLQPSDSRDQPVISPERSRVPRCRERSRVR